MWSSGFSYTLVCRDRGCAYGAYEAAGRQRRLEVQRKGAYQNCCVENIY